MVPQIESGWKVYSTSRAVPSTASFGRHNRLILVDHNGVVRRAIDGHPENGQWYGGAKMQIQETSYDDRGNYVSGLGPSFSDETDPSRFVEIPNLNGLSTEETWQNFLNTGAEHDLNHNYLFAPNGPAHYIDEDGITDLVESSFNSNIAWATMLDENGYDPRDYHPEEGVFETSPGDEFRLPNPSEEEVPLSPEEYERQVRCFAAGTPIEMADGTTKPIEDIAIDDMVLAFDGDADQGRGAKVAKRVTQLHRTKNQVVFDFHGLRVTPGHAFLTGDGEFKPLIEILEEDGTVVLSGGETIRARTGWPVGSDKDRAIPVGCPTDDKVEILTMRAGTLYGVKEGIALTIQEMMKSRGYHLRTDGRFVNVEGDVKTAFWEWGMPEDKMIAGKRASYDDLIEGSVIATGIPLMPSRPN